MIQTQLGRRRITVDGRVVILHRVKGLHIRAERNIESSRDVAIDAQESIKTGRGPGNDRADVIGRVRVPNILPWIRIETNHVRMRAVDEINEKTIADLPAPIV